MTSFAAPRHVAVGPDTLTADDFETASIHSAAPSYISDTPSYHSTAPADTAPAPPYAPCEADSSPIVQVNRTADNTDGHRTPTRQTSNRPTGLPPVPTTPLPMVPSLSAFAIPTWSTFTANPRVRHYQSVAQRRVAAANDRTSSLSRRLLLEGVLEEEEERAREFRPLEDPYLVGEEAARRARAERLARERPNDVLLGENHRWDWYMAQMRDMNERERNWSRFRSQMEVDERKSFIRRISGRLAF